MEKKQAEILERGILCIMVLGLLHLLFMWLGSGKNGGLAGRALPLETADTVSAAYPSYAPTLAPAVQADATPAAVPAEAVSAAADTLPDIIGIDDIVFEPEMDADSARQSIQQNAPTYGDRDKLYDFNYLYGAFYLVEKKNTELFPSDVDVNGFLNADLSLDMSVPGPKILIFHTHSNEMYADSDPSNPMDGIMGVGKALADILNNQYGVEALHHMGRYDVVNGVSQIPGAYERMEPDIKSILRDNPSIEMVIDLHRDGLAEGVPPMVADVDGRRTARIMFVNGLSRLRTGDNLAPVAGLENPFIPDNLALSFRLQLTANELFPDFTRKLYLKPYRYSLGLLPKALLVEIGAQNNTKQEAVNAMAPLAESIARVVLK